MLRAAYRRAPSNDFTSESSKGARRSVRYPEQRARLLTPHDESAPVYERIDGPAGLVTAGDTDAVVFTFSGKPDAIYLASRAFDAIFTLDDPAGAEQSVVLVAAGDSVLTYISRRRVQVRNAVAGSNAIVNVAGLWQARAESR